MTTVADRLFQAERIHDGRDWHRDAALRVRGGRVVGIEPAGSGAHAGVEPMPGCIVPGLVDLQVNGGGGVMLNDAPTAETLATIVAAHERFGTTGLMATLITDRPEVTEAAIEAVASVELPGLLGLHLEGPHIAPARKGTHDPALIRPMEARDLSLLLSAARRLPHLMVTLAPESVTLAQVAALADAGVVVSLGHSDCDLGTARAYADAGARMVTHLYNAMSQLGHRAPGLVGAALSDGRLAAGLIADGFHVEDAALGIALRGKAGPAGMFLVSDAMATVGSPIRGFTLNGRQILRGAGRLTLADGTLAGADIALVDAVRHCRTALGLPLEAALALATTAPAAALGVADRGHLRPGARADFLCLGPDTSALATVVGGERVA